ncbi:hypothetical protein ACJ41O_009156 [Fusarium nematophilum]
MDDTQSLSKAIAKSYAIVSLLGPTLGDRSADPEFLPKVYKSYIFPLMREHGVRRIYAMGTLSITQPNDSWSLLRSAVVLLVRTVAGGAYRTIIGIGEVFEKDGGDLDWTVYRIAGIPGGSDKESWERDREDGKAFVGWVAEKGWTMSQRRGALARWLVDAVEGGLQEWVRKMPAVSRLQGS